jgi:hypothetical protein
MVQEFHKQSEFALVLSLVSSIKLTTARPVHQEGRVALDLEEVD